MENPDLVREDAKKLLAYMDAQGIDASETLVRGWQHMGVLIVDAVMQRRLRYESIVVPRVRAIREQWPDADTTDNFLAHMTEKGLSDVFDWPSREQQMIDIAKKLQELQIQTVDELGAALSDEGRRDEVRAGLRQVHNVGPKTLDYIDILAGLSDSAAIDSRIIRAAKNAGIENTSYEHLAAVLRAVAEERGWRVGDIDGWLWRTHGDD